MRAPWAILALLVAAAAGCATPVAAPVFHDNPTLLPLADRDYVFDQVVDVVDDYFTIDREQRVRVVGTVLTEGRIDTFPEVGATLLEPWRQDSVNNFERWESTLQTIRRTAQVRVIPTGEGYLVDVVVFKELEDLQKPQHASAGAATLRNDTSLERFDLPVLGQPFNRGWIPLGRDQALEQQIIADLQTRFRGPAPSPAVAPNRLPPVTLP